MRWIEGLLDLLYPRECCVCGKILEIGEKFLCNGCHDDIPFTYYWSWMENPAEKKLWGRVYLERVIPLFFYSRESKYINLVHRIKYRGDIPLAHHLGKMLGEKILVAGIDVDVIVPVPLHWRKRWKRGYNQSEEIAKGVAEVLFGKKIGRKRVVTNLICRKKYTPTQTKVGMDRKWENVKDAFAIKNGIPDKYQHILLIDDVLTSGATLEACATVLMEQLGCRVSIATLAYVE